MAGLALVTAGQIMLAPRQAQAPAAASAWKEQEKKTQSELQRTVEGGQETVRMRLAKDRGLWWRFEIALLGLSCLTVGVLYQWGRLFFRRVLLRRPPELPTGSPPIPLWGGRQLFWVVLSVLLVLQACDLAQMMIVKAFHPPWLDGRVGALAHTLLADAVVAAWAIRLFSRQGIRLEPAKIPAGILAGFRGYLLALPVLFLILLGVAAMLNLMGIDPAPQPVFTLYLSEHRWAVVQLLLALAVVFGPIAEELFFRGLVYGWLRVRIGVRGGLLISSLLFAALHMDGVAFVPILGLGLLFGWVYERTGSLVAPIAIHIFHNGAMLYVASVMKALISQG